MDPATSTYTSRLATFLGHWDDELTAARQLAALGHVCDRPPLESLEPGSRCITCGAFSPKAHSIRILGDDAHFQPSSASTLGFSGVWFHETGCTRLQLRIPLDPQSVLPGLYGARSRISGGSDNNSCNGGGGGGINAVRAQWERRISNTDPTSSSWPTCSSLGKTSASDEQTCTLFSLPPELRLAIYELVLPSLDPVTQIVPLNRDSPRVLTLAGAARTGPRDTTKPNLLRTCRAVHSEALTLLYNGNNQPQADHAGQNQRSRQGPTTFSFANTKTLFLFLRSIGSAGRRCVRGVDVKAGEREDAVAFALLAACGRLEKFVLRLPRPVLLITRAPLWSVEGMACLLALRGLKEVRFEGCESSWAWLAEGMEGARVVREALMGPREEGEVEGDMHGNEMMEVG